MYFKELHEIQPRERLKEMEIDIDRIDQAIITEVWENITQTNTMNLDEIIIKELFIQLREQFEKYWN